jgi:hypothetical protein
VHGDAFVVSRLLIETATTFVRAGIVVTRVTCSSQRLMLVEVSVPTPVWLARAVCPGTSQAIIAVELFAREWVWKIALRLFAFLY